MATSAEVSVIVGSILQQVHRGVYLTHGPEFDYQLYLLFAIQGLSLLFVVAALTARGYYNRLWVYRVQRTRMGSYVIPNPVVCWLLLSIMVLGLLVKMTHTTMLYGQSGANLRNIVLWRAMPWIPLWIAAWIMTWTTALTPLRNRQSSSNKFATSSYLAVVANSILILVPLFVIILPLYFNITANNAFNNLFNQFEQLEALAASGATVPLEVLQSLPGEVQTMFDEVLITVRRIWVCWAVLVPLLLLIFSIVSFNQCMTFRASISEIRKQHSSTSASLGNTKLSSLVWAYRTLLFTTVMTGLMMRFYIALALILVFRLEEVMKGDRIAEFVILFGIYIYSILGLFTNIVIYSRSFEFQPAAVLPSTNSLSVFTKTNATLPQRPPGEVMVLTRAGQTGTFFELDLGGPRFTKSFEEREHVKDMPSPWEGRGEAHPFTYMNGDGRW